MFRASQTYRVSGRPTPKLLLRVSAALFLAGVTSRGAGAQAPSPAPDLASLGGLVLDARTDEPLGGAIIIVSPPGAGEREVVSGPEGRFLVPGLAPGEHVIRIRFGGRTAEPRSIRLAEGDHTEIRVSIFPGESAPSRGVPVAELPPLEIEIAGEARPGKLREFWQRRETSHGHFISGPEIRERSPFRTSDLIREVPGLIVTRDPGGRPGLRVGRSGRCAIEFYVDGAPAPGLSIDDIAPGDIDGLEIYRGVSEVPIQYRRATTCAAVLIWTRDPGLP